MSSPYQTVSAGLTACCVNTNESTLISGTITMRALSTRFVTRALLPYSLASIVASSIATSADGHSRAWCSATTNHVGRPSSAAFTFFEISMPWIGRPWVVCFGSSTGRTRFG